MSATSGTHDDESIPGLGRAGAAGAAAPPGAAA